MHTHWQSLWQIHSRDGIKKKIRINEKAICGQLLDLNVYHHNRFLNNVPSMPKVQFINWEKKMQNVHVGYGFKYPKYLHWINQKNGIEKQCKVQFKQQKNK